MIHLIFETYFITIDIVYIVLDYIDVYLYKYIYIFTYVYRIYRYFDLHMYIYTSLPIFLHLHSLRIMTSQATSASVAANVVSGAWRRVLLLGEGLATRIFVYVGLEWFGNLFQILILLCWFGNWFQILSLCSISCLRGAGCRILEQTPKKTVFQDLGMWAMSSSSLLRRGDFSFASAAAILHQDCDLDATTVLPGRHDDQ